MNFLRFYPRPTDAAAETATAATDAALVSACLAGSQTAWRKLVEKYSRLVMSIPGNAGLTPEESQDVLQETFLALFKHLLDLNEPEKLRAWLVTAAKLNTLAAQKRIAKERRTALPVHDWNGDLQRIEQQDELLRVLDALPPTQRIVLRAALTESIMPLAEIAKLAGIQPESVSKTRRRGLERLRQFFGKE